MMQLPKLEPYYCSDKPGLDERYLKALSMGVTLQEVLLDPEKRFSEILSQCMSKPSVF